MCRNRPMIRTTDQIKRGNHYRGKEWVELEAYTRNEAMLKEVRVLLAKLNFETELIKKKKNKLVYTHPNKDRETFVFMYDEYGG